MIEQAMAELTAALNANTAALLDAGTPAQPGGLPRLQPAPAPIVAPAGQQPPANVTPIAPPQPTPAPAPAPVATAAPAPAPAPAATAAVVTKEELNDLMVAKAGQMGDNGAAIFEILRTHFNNAATIADVPPEHLPVLKQHIDALGG